MESLFGDFPTIVLAPELAGSFPERKRIKMKSDEIRKGRGTGEAWTNGGSALFLFFSSGRAASMLEARCRLVLLARHVVALGPRYLNTTAVFFSEAGELPLV